MEQAIAELEENIDSADIDQIVPILNRIVHISSSLDPETLSTYSLDPLIRRLLRSNRCVELVEKIADLLPLIRDPRNFQDELISLLEIRPLALPVLMLIFQLSQDFDFTYGEFYNNLEDILSVDNIQSEGFLFFILRCLEPKDIDFETLKSFLQRLSSLAVFISSVACIKVLYCILVIMRMHPAAFRVAKDLKELYILAYSFESIRNIVKRIFIEAKHPKRRPKVIFLESFTFPALDDCEQ